MKLRIRNLLLLLILISCAAAGFAAGFTETKKMAEAVQGRQDVDKTKELRFKSGGPASTTP